MHLDQVIQMRSEIDEHPAHAVDDRCYLCRLEDNLGLAVNSRGRSRNHRVASIFLFFLHVILGASDSLVREAPLVGETTDAIGRSQAQVMYLLHHFGKGVLRKVGGVGTLGV